MKSTPAAHNDGAGAGLTFADGLWQMLARTSHLVAKLRQKELHQYGINMNEAVTLFTVLHLGERATPTNTSRQLFWEPHTVSELLKSMEAKGLIRRIRDLARRSMMRVEVTDKRMQSQLSPARSTRKAMSVLTKEEQTHLWSLLAKIREYGMKQSALESLDPFPPSDPGSFRLRRPRRRAGSPASEAEKTQSKSGEARRNDRVDGESKESIDTLSGLRATVSESAPELPS
jgi:DNA-binding MarR family transcriptional regulator